MSPKAGKPSKSSKTAKRTKPGRASAAEQRQPKVSLAPLGHESIVARLGALTAAIAAGNRQGLHHAYLFSGPAGVGKYVVANWWARSLVCPTNGDCGGACKDCRLVSVGVHPDVLVVERPSDKTVIGIEAARGMISRLGLRASGTGPRIGIIRDAELLSSDAQSSLLKLLEEPPGFALLILVTGNPSAMFSTVRSRCRQLPFGLLSDDTVAQVLKGQGSDTDSAKAAASAARGRVDRALDYDGEGLVDREELLLNFEQVCAGSGDMEGLVQHMVGRKSEGYGMDELFAWQVKKLEACLGESPAEPSDALRKVLSGLDVSSLKNLVHAGERVQRTIQALGRNSNARMTIRDLLLDVKSWKGRPGQLTQ